MFPLRSKTFQDYTNHYKALHVSVCNTDSNLFCLLWWWTQQNYIPLPTFTAWFSACTPQLVTDPMHGCHGMLFSGLACQRLCQLPLRPTFLNRNWPKLTTGITKSWCRLVEMSSRQSVYKWSKIQDSVHQGDWHVASYCCFIQTAPTLDSTYIKHEICKTFFWQKTLEGLLFKWTIAESATPTLWDLCLDVKIYYLHRGS